MEDTQAQGQSGDAGLSSRLMHRALAVTPGNGLQLCGMLAGQSS
jgi:hypothetical protein